MFVTLLETSPRRARSPRDAALSLGVHALLIASAVAVTANANVARATMRVVPGSVVYVAPRTAPPVATTPPVAPAPPDISLPTERIPRVIIAPVEVPDGIPTIPAAADTSAWTTRAAPPSVGTPSTTPRGANGSWTEGQVEKPALPLPGAIPSYPDFLRLSGTDGEVVAQFVVDTLGRVEAGSFRAVHASHALFALAVERVLPKLRFVPAEAGGRRVRQLVQQPFQFAITR